MKRRKRTSSDSIENIFRTLEEIERFVEKGTRRTESIDSVIGDVERSSLRIRYVLILFANKYSRVTITALRSNDKIYDLAKRGDTEALKKYVKRQFESMGYRVTNIDVALLKQGDCYKIKYKVKFDNGFYEGFDLYC